MRFYKIFFALLLLGGCETIRDFPITAEQVKKEWQKANSTDVDFDETEGYFYEYVPHVELSHEDVENGCSINISDSVFSYASIDCEKSIFCSYSKCTINFWSKNDLKTYEKRIDEMSSREIESFIEGARRVEVLSEQRFYSNPFSSPEMWEKKHFIVKINPSRSDPWTDTKEMYNLGELIPADIMYKAHAATEKRERIEEEKRKKKERIAREKREKEEQRINQKRVEEFIAKKLKHEDDLVAAWKKVGCPFIYPLSRDAILYTGVKYWCEKNKHGMSVVFYSKVPGKERKAVGYKEADGEYFMKGFERFGHFYTCSSQNDCESTLKGVDGNVDRYVTQQYKQCVDQKQKECKRYRLMADPVYAEMALKCMMEIDCNYDASVSHFFLD